jgi:preprotein translocase subunit YajC
MQHAALLPRRAAQGKRRWAARLAATPCRFACAVAFAAAPVIYASPLTTPSIRALAGAPPELSPLFIASAFAQANGAAPTGSTDMLIQFAPFIAIFAIMYFLILRPQQKRAKDQRAMVQSARRGDIVVTNGGLIGKVTKSIDDTEVELEIAPNVRVRLARSGIADVRSKGEPVKDASGAKTPPAKKDAANP